MADTSTTTTSANGYRFNRHYIVKIGESDNPSGFIIDSSKYTPDMVPEIEFEVKKDNESNPNETKLVIYGLKPTTRAYLDKQNQNVELYAGYTNEGEPPLIAKGIIVNVQHELENPGCKSTITFFDGWKELKDTVLSISYEKGNTVHTIMKAIANKMGIVMNISKGAKNSTYKSGFSYSGSPAAALSKLCARAGLKWSIQDGALQITNLNSNTQRRAISLNSQSGLIGSPKAVKLANRDIDDDASSNPESKRKKNTVEIKSTKKERNGWDVKSLIIGYVNPSDLVNVTSTRTSCNGVYRVESLTHKGKYRSTDTWRTEMVIVEDDAFEYSFTPV